ncbi:MAG: glycoside hydrolase family 3 protein [Clostridia bacterium]|nr:glycoside hydrolase family 3 protein [Clostridia bacterium]
MKKLLALLSMGLLLMPTAMGEEDPVLLQMEKMSLREKVGQLFMIRPDALESRFGPAELEDNSITGTTRVSDEMRQAYANYPCGGFALFRKNILSPSQLNMFTQNLHTLNDLTPMLGIDEEGGRIARIANHPANFGVRKFSSMGSIAASGDESKAFEVGRTIGQYLKAYGFNIDFAPVADVNTNPRNPVIGDRAFGNDPNAAAVMVRRVIEGLHSSGVASCIKHFPGHGDTATDTHTGYAETKKTWEEISSCEMIPFRAGIAAGTDFVMTAHIAAPNVTGTDEPSTMSYTVLTEKLRGELGFEGLIITDALSMGAITEKYSSSEACIRCIKAGVDVLLMPYDYFEAFDGVAAAVERGEISEARLNESVYRVLKFKRQVGL